MEHFSSFHHHLSLNHFLQPGPLLEHPHSLSRFHSFSSFLPQNHPIKPHHTQNKSPSPSLQPHILLSQDCLLNLTSNTQPSLVHLTPHELASLLPFGHPGSLHLQVLSFVIPSLYPPMVGSFTSLDLFHMSCLLRGHP